MATALRFNTITDARRLARIIQKSDPLTEKFDASDLNFDCGQADDFDTFEVTTELVELFAKRKGISAHAMFRRLNASRKDHSRLYDQFCEFCLPGGGF